MKSLFLVFSFAFIFSYSNLSATVCDSIGSITKDGKKYIQYKVEKGTTLYSLSRKYNVSVDEILKVNSIQAINIDQIILIPDKKGKVNTLKKNTHIVAVGETLFAISQKTGVSVEDIKKLNQLTDNSISVGQVLLLSKTTTKTKEEFKNIHIVAKGETLYSIATKYSVAVDELKKINGLKTNELDLGQKLVLPAIKESKSSLRTQQNIKLLNSKSDLLDQNLCEVLSPIGNEGEILKIITPEGKTVYARIVGKSNDNQIYSSSLVFKLLNITTFSTSIDIEFCVTK